jgi:hypothetical protein
LVGGSFTPWINIELGAAWTRRLPLQGHLRLRAHSRPDEYDQQSAGTQG